MSDHTKPQPAPAPGPEPATARPELKDEIVETEHTVVINDQIVVYTATTGRMVIKDEEGKSKATIFFIAYTRKNVENPSRRPLTISFNGGPGSSSVWLHLGLLGPRRVVSGDVDSPVPPPYRLTDNEFSLLDVTDLVFVDPVGTGFSRPAPGEEAKQFHGLEQDVESVGEFIRLFVSRYKRWSSPKFLIGESYGTTRASALAGHLQSKYGLYLNGLLLVSVVLNFQTLEFEIGNDLPYILYVPAYAATAWYHKRLAPELQADFVLTLKDAEAFAYRRGEITKEEMMRLFKQNSRRYAKRQMTWFRRDERIVWIKMKDDFSPLEVAEKILHEMPESRRR
jgi:carboxypeptidase C (cathepsin A)